jgi:SAM-dependent methyltransferase
VTDEREIRAYYDRGAEAGRLADWGRLEFVRTMELLGRFLPAPPAVVLDVGGAAGVYALPLTDQGYEVHLVDPIPLHLEQARAASAAAANRLTGVTLGDARELPHEDDCADAVLMLGPLYHLTDAGDRHRALTEAARVLRPGGLLAAAAISRFASTMDGIWRGFLAEPGFEALVERDVAEGPAPQPRAPAPLVHHRLLPPPRRARGGGGPGGLRGARAVGH